MPSYDYVGPAYKLKSGKSWSFRHGSNKVSGGTFRNETECNKARNKKIAEYETGSAQAGAGMLFGKILDELIEYEGRRRAVGATKPRTEDGYIKIIERFIRPAFGPLKLKEVTWGKMYDFQTALINTGQFSASCICRTVLRLTWDLACRKEYCIINLARVGAPLPARQPQARKQICRDEQYARLTRVTEKGFWSGWRSELHRRNIDATIKIARNHLCRHGDICGLRPIDIEWDNKDGGAPFGWIWFRRSWCAVGKCIQTTKGSSSGKGYKKEKVEQRHQHMSREEREALELVWEMQREAWMRDGCPDDWPLFRCPPTARSPDPSGVSYYNQLDYDFATAMRLAELVDEDGKLLFHLHDMRRRDRSAIDALGVSASEFAAVIGDTEATALTSYLNQDDGGEEGRRRRMEVLDLLRAPPRPKGEKLNLHHPLSPPLLLTAENVPGHEMDTTPEKEAENKGE